VGDCVQKRGYGMLISRRDKCKEAHDQQ
jgi:hypothetical protein